MPLFAPSSAAQFIASMPPVRCPGNPVITHEEPWTDLSPGGWTVDPLDREQFLLYVGRFRGNHSVGADVAVYSGLREDPFRIDFECVALSTNPAGADDDMGVRFGSVVELGGTLHYFYVGNRSDGAQTVMLATSTDGRTFTKRGTVVAPDGIHEHYLTDPTVLRHEGRWLMYATAKSAAKRPTLGIAVYTSDDAMRWARTGVTAIPLGGDRDLDSKYTEGCDVGRWGDDFVTLYTACSEADEWSVGMAWSPDALAPFTKVDRPAFAHAPVRWDARCVAMPLVVSPTRGRWLTHYQGCAQPQPASAWDVGAAELVAPTQPAP